MEGQGRSLAGRWVHVVLRWGSRCGSLSCQRFVTSYAPDHAFDEQLDMHFTGAQGSLHAIRSFPFNSLMALLLSDGAVWTLAHSLHHVAIGGAQCRGNSIISSP